MLCPFAACSGLGDTSDHLMCVASDAMLLFPFPICLINGSTIDLVLPCLVCDGEEGAQQSSGCTAAAFDVSELSMLDSCSSLSFLSFLIFGHRVADCDYRNERKQQQQQQQ